MWNLKRVPNVYQRFEPFKVLHRTLCWESVGLDAPVHLRGTAGYKLAAKLRNSHSALALGILLPVQFATTMTLKI